MAETIKVPDGTMEKIRSMMKNTDIFVGGVKSALEVPQGYGLDIDKGEFVKPKEKETPDANAS
jgi:hypothetical protein